VTPALVLTGLGGAAFADPPDQWKENTATSPLHVLLVLVVIPLSLIAIITLLVYLPSMSKGERYQPGQPWRSEPLWFGGPRGGLERVDRNEQPAVSTGGESGRGGASGRW